MLPDGPCSLPETWQDTDGAVCTPVPTTESQNLHLKARSWPQKLLIVRTLQISQYNTQAMTFQNYQSHLLPSQSFRCSPPHLDHSHKRESYGCIIQKSTDGLTTWQKVTSLIGFEAKNEFTGDWQSKSQLIHKQEKTKIPPYLHTGSLVVSSILFLSHFPRFAVHNTEIGEEQNVSTITVGLPNFQDSHSIRHSHLTSTTSSLLS